MTNGIETKPIYFYEIHIIFNGIGVGRLALAWPLPGPNGLPGLFLYPVCTRFVPGLYPVYTVGWTGWLGCGCLAGSAGLAPTLCGRHIKNITKRISRNINKYYQISRNINKYDQILTEQYQ